MIDCRKITPRRTGGSVARKMRGIKGLSGGDVSPHAVIDVASNSIHLLVGEVEDGTVLPVTKVSARPESGVDETGKAKSSSGRGESPDTRRLSGSSRS